MFKTKNFTVHDDGNIEFKDNWSKEEQKKLEETVEATAAAVREAVAHFISCKRDDNCVCEELDDQSEGSELGRNRRGQRFSSTSPVPEVDPSSGPGDAAE